MKANGIINNTNTIETANMTEKEITTMKKTNNKAIICIETNETFSSIREAAKHFNTSGCNISHVLTGKQKSAKGFHFKYINSTEVTPIEAKPEEPINPDIPKEIIVQHKAVVKGKGKRMNGNTKAVFDFTTGAFYTSGVDAAEIIGTTQGNVSRVCNSRGRKANGHKICYVRNIPEHLDEIGNAIRKANMYDDLMTKEEKRKELLTNLKSLESKADNITYEISRLLEELADTEKEIEKAKDELINFGIN